MTKQKVGARTRLTEYVKRERRILIHQTKLAMDFDKDHEWLGLLITLSGLFLVVPAIIGIYFSLDPLLTILPGFVSWLAIMIYYDHVSERTKIVTAYRKSLKESLKDGWEIIDPLEIPEWVEHHFCSGCQGTPPCVDCVLVPSDFEPGSKESGIKGDNNINTADYLTPAKSWKLRVDEINKYVMDKEKRHSLLSAIDTAITRGKFPYEVPELDNLIRKSVELEKRRLSPNRPNLSDVS